MEPGAAGAETTGRTANVPAADPATFADLSAHTHHASDSPGSRCVECHMSDVNWRLITRRRDHSFQPPVPEMTSRFGVPNACTTCHEDKSPEWAASTMDRWYGNGARRRAVVAMADVMYRAGTGDVSVLPDVARLASDRSHGALIRASAGEFAGQLIARGADAAAKGTGQGADEQGRGQRTEGRGQRAEGTAQRAEGTGQRAEGTAQKADITPATMNALIGAASDPEPMVRVTAVRALALIQAPQIAPVLAAHLGDPARLVRIAAAQSLMAIGIDTLPAESGQALARAQDEWAISLATFNDVAADHTALGWLMATRGRTDEAATELKNAIALDPADARPHVFLGVIAARAGRFAEALQYFKFAKTLAPAYQNLDRLIAEAEKRVNRRD
jgi:hypothetical protein